MDRLAAFFVTALIAAAQGYPGGAPKGTCDSMLPGHGGIEGKEESNNPYKLSANDNEGDWSVSVSSAYDGYKCSPNK